MAKPATVAQSAPQAPVWVPRDFIVTPNGYFNASCVRHVASHASVDIQTGAIGARGDSSAQAARPCPFPRFTASGRRIDSPVSRGWRPELRPTENRAASAQRPPAPARASSTAGSAPSYIGWIMAAAAITSADAHAISYLSADFIVPDEPTRTSASGTIYFFPGAEGTKGQGADQYTIIQPVLGWHATGTPHWTIASWNCCVDGNTNYSSLRQVASGDHIHGVMQGSNCDADSGICSDWTIITTDTDSGVSTTLRTSAYKQAFDWIQAGVLEVYGFNSCAHLPRSGYIDFRNVVLKDIAGDAMQLSFSPRFFMPLHYPWCNYRMRALVPHEAFRLSFLPARGTRASKHRQRPTRSQ